ncbi:MAG: cytochrome c [Methylovirgula sp.]
MKKSMKSILFASMLMIPLIPSVAFAWPWSKDMMSQISIKPQQDPIPFPPRSVPVPGTATTYVPNQDYAAKMPNPIPPTAASVEKGRELFTIYCTACHGASGTGNGTVGEKLTIRPFDLTSDGVQSLSDGFIFGILTFGNVVMPSYANDLSPTERWHVINFVHHGLKPTAPVQAGNQTK